MDGWGGEQGADGKHGAAVWRVAGPVAEHLVRGGVLLAASAPRSLENGTRAEKV